MIHSIRTTVAQLSITAALTLTSHWIAAAEPPALFLDPDAAAARRAARQIDLERPGLRRARMVCLNIKAFDRLWTTASNPAPGAPHQTPASTPVLRINLFDDTVFTISTSQADRSPTGARTLMAELDGASGGRFSIGLSDAYEAVSGSVYTPAATWLIATLGNGVHVIREFDPQSPE